MSRPEDNLTVTSFAILGLLAIRPWTTYELAQQMRRSLVSFWPRAESRIYEEPKRLVALALARSSNQFTGQRPRTVYSITPKGRRRLARWLGEPGAAGPQLEFELLLKVFFSEHGTKAHATDAIEEIGRWADERTVENIGFAREFLATGGPFPERLGQIVLVGRFLTDFADMIASWSQWARDVVAGWPDDPRGVEPDVVTLESIAARTPPELPAPEED
jgi:PadR family transcriptional regulator, regulatory protein AphA